MLDELVLRSLFEDAVRRSGVFGAQLSIIKGDEQVDFAAGVVHAERGQAMTTDTVMQIGSITKVFSAVIVVSLEQEGLLDLNTPVKHYIPTFEVADRQASRELTLRHLLSMSSGLDNGRYVNFGGGEDALGKHVEYLKTLLNTSHLGNFGYSNASTCIAGHVASTVSGKSWETLLQERILEPAGLKRSAILDDDLRDKVVSAGHYASPTGGKPTIVDPIFTAARGRAPSGASFALATSDLARFGKMFIKKGIADTGASILSESSVKLMTRPQTYVPNRMYATSWCVGPLMDTWNGIRVWGHSGGTETSLSFLRWFPEQEGVFAFNLNTPLAMGEFSRIALDEILNAAFDLRKPRIEVTDAPLTAINHRRYVGTYEELGMRLHVTRGEGNTLRARFVPQRIAQEARLLMLDKLKMDQSDQSVILKPLGGDRFLVNPLEDSDKLHGMFGTVPFGIVDTAFFGDDGEGRATNVINTVFPLQRLPMRETS